MLQYGLIKEDEIGGTDEIRLYNVVDTKLKYLIKRNLASLVN